MVATQQVLVRCVGQLISLGFCCSRRLAHFLGREDIRAFRVAVSCLRSHIRLLLHPLNVLDLLRNSPPD